MSAQMLSAWASFATHGDPGWPAYDTDQRLVQRFDTEPAVVAVPGGAVPADLAATTPSPCCR